MTPSCPKCATYRKNLEAVLRLVKNGELVRDISQDHLPMWSIQAGRVVTTLKEAMDCLGEGKKEK